MYMYMYVSTCMSMYICVNVYVYVCIYTYGYHGARLLLERNGVDRLLSAQIPVTDHNRGEQLGWTGNVRHVQQRR